MLFWALLLLLSLVSFDANDPSLNHVVSGAAVVRNKAGLFGAYAAGFLNDVFGVVALLCPLAFGALGAACISSAYSLHWLRWCGFFLMTICLLVMAAAWDFSVGDLWGGGMVGNALHHNASRYLSPGGSALLWIFVALMGTQLAGNISWFALTGRLGRWLHARWLAWREKADQEAKTSYRAAEAAPAMPDAAAEGPEDNSFAARLRARLHLPSREFWTGLRDRLGDIRPTADRLPKVYEENGAEGAAPQHAAAANLHGAGQGDAAAPQVAPSSVPQDDDDPFPVTETFGPVAASPQSAASAAAAQAAAGATPVPAPQAASPAPAAAAQPSRGGVRAALAPLLGKKAPIPLPSLDLLAPPAKTPAGPAREDREARGKALIACLRDFDIQGELVRITPGPVVTMYEVRPAPGIRVSRIANLSDDLALALKAIAVRIQAPIPGTDTVGIEIPNENRETVNFRELAASEAFRKGCGPLTMILGKDIAGQPYMADLTRMPHLLVAGATGAGKSVCLNGILISLLYRTQPEDLQLLLVDPKRIEMAVYADEPHLVHPVVTEMSEAKNALDWAVHEMDRRYEAMARLGVRNVAGFNQKLAAYKNDLPPDFADLEPLPYLVIVIDELADLMMTAAREVETSIVRLAQLARAAGIHMILATQRPSVDVVTGLIKANFPCRISFQVTSKHDSRTILDQVGAEHLLGRGDMLFKPSGGRLLRLHGPFLSDEDVQRVVGHWKRHLNPAYKVDFAQWSPEGAAGGGAGGGGGDAAQDPLYGEVQVFVSEQGRASISLVQRRFKIGFNRAARLVEQLEQDGIIGPADGSKPRAVVK
ncbi:DNA translocase FtsK [Desulfovibrio legallii]|uniref:DNA translocase FtsK n=1 Tax=Desulfovibrio legallii TaxID=571438 RepID=UPI0035A2BE44